MNYYPNLAALAEELRKRANNLDENIKAGTGGGLYAIGMRDAYQAVAFLLDKSEIEPKPEEEKWPPSVEYTDNYRLKQIDEDHIILQRLIEHKSTGKKTWMDVPTAPLNSKNDMW